MGRLTFKEADLKVFQENISKNRKTAVPVEKRNKYGNKKTLVDGISFDSKKESNRYLELKMLQRAGEITNLEMQKTFELKVNDFLICKYVCDFAYVDHANGKKFVVEDVKSESTRAIKTYSIKRKLMQAIYNIIITEK